MKWNKQFKYPNSQRSIKGEYDISKMLLPSVTTVLNATQPEDKRKSLDKWARRVGDDEATRIKELAGRRGTAMHFYLQKHLDPDCKGYMDLTQVGRVAEPMAKKIIEKGKYHRCGTNISRDRILSSPSVQLRVRLGSGPCNPCNRDPDVSVGKNA